MIQHLVALIHEWLGVWPVERGRRDLLIELRNASVRVLTCVMAELMPCSMPPA